MGHLSEADLLVVLGRLLRELPVGGIHVATLQPSDSLLDLGLDSLSFVDLSVALEDALAIAEFPMQAWADSEAERVGPRFTCGSLLQACVPLVGSALR